MNATGQVRASGVGVLLLGLSVLCTATAAWVTPAEAGPSSDRTLSKHRVAAPTLPRPTSYSTTSYSTTEVVVPTRRGDRPGTLLLPGTAGPHPAVVMVGGSGTGHRASLLAAATELARRGVVALVYDKNVSGYSWRVRDYDALGADAADAARTLTARPEVDPERIGLWGFSEGGWVVASTAAAEPSVAFVVMVSAPTVSPGEQAGWVVSRALAERGLHLLQHGVALHLSANPGMVTYTDYRPPLAEVHQPVLAVFGAEDRTVPVVTAVTVLRAELSNRPTVQVFADSGHGLTTPAGGPAAGYYDRTVAWIQRLDDADLVEVDVSQPALAAPPSANAAVHALLYASAPLLVVGAVTLGVGLVLSTRRSRLRRPAR